MVSKISVKFLIKATELRNRAIAEQKGEQIPSLFEIAQALEEMENKNSSAKSSGESKPSVINWIKSRLTKGTAIVEQPKTEQQKVQAETVMPQTYQAEQEQNKPQQNKSNSLQDVYTQLSSLNIKGVKIEMVQKPKYGV